MAEKVKRVVAHPRYYAMVKGKLTLIPKGTTIEVTEEVAKAKGSKLGLPGELQSLKDGELQNSEASAGNSAELVKAKAETEGLRQGLKDALAIVAEKQELIDNAKPAMPADVQAAIAEMQKQVDAAITAKNDAEAKAEKALAEVKTLKVAAKKK